MRGGRSPTAFVVVWRVCLDGHLPSNPQKGKTSTEHQEKEKKKKKRKKERRKRIARRAGCGKMRGKRSFPPPHAHYSGIDPTATYIMHLPTGSHRTAECPHIGGESERGDGGVGGARARTRASEGAKGRGGEGARGERGSEGRTRERVRCTRGKISCSLADELESARIAVPGAATMLGWDDWT